MSATKSLIAVLVLAIAIPACATHKINYSNPQMASGGTTHTAKQSFFLWGLVGGAEIDLPKLCPSGVARIESKSSAMDGIFAAITAGLYSPMSVEVQCASGGSSAMVGGGQR